MATKTIVAITNKDPSEISDLGPASQALLERFPLQLEVVWDSYESSDYNELFEKVAPSLPGASLNGSQRILAEIIAKTSSNGDIISPRTAIHALGIAKSAAALRGSSTVNKEDLVDLHYLPGMEELAENIRKELDDAYERSQAEGIMKAAEEKFKKIISELNGDLSPVKALQVAKRLEEFQDVISDLKVTDNLSERRKSIREAITVKIEEATKIAFENTKI